MDPRVKADCRRIADDWTFADTLETRIALDAMNQVDEIAAEDAKRERL